jgi:hypothetical protein
MKFQEKEREQQAIGTIDVMGEQKVITTGPYSII